MKPINLKIKGLNSFIETQEVDFERLTQKGLFGIFGSTGSGKSTILDGITLALYGEVSRNSSNYMNTNCNSMNVSYEFQMTEKEVKRYRVDREFKRDNKTGNVRAKSAKIVDTTHEELVLEDKPRFVTEKCEEIIGLKLDDFTRTVVLPQGKFSEFLKLAGKERRDMLERLFNLQSYGDDLSNKLKCKIDEENQKSNVLDGEIKGYEDISDEVLEEKNKTLFETKDKCKKCHNELNEAEKSYNEGKELWELQNELKDLKNKEKLLQEKEKDIKESQLKVTRGESVLKIKPYIDGYENTISQINSVDFAIKTLKEKAEIIKEDKNKAEIKLEEAKNKKDNQLPLLKIKEQKILEAIEEKKALDVLVNENKTLEGHILKSEYKLSDINTKIETSGKSILSIGENIIRKESKSESLQVPEEFKNKVNDGFVILNENENIKKQIIKLKKEIEETKSNIKEASRKSETLSMELNEKENSLKISDEQLKKLTNKCPGDQNTLLELKEKLVSAKDNWGKYKEFNAAMDKSCENIEVYNKELKEKEMEKILLDEETCTLKNNIKKTETENLAHTLRETLSDGEACPVCGSKDHYRENLEIPDYSNNLEQLRIKLSSKEDKLKKLIAEIIKHNMELNSEKDNIKVNEVKLNELGKDFMSFSVEALQNEFDKMYVDINKYNNDKAGLEKIVRVLSEERSMLMLKYSNINSTLSHNREQLKKLQDELNSKFLEFKESDMKFTQLKTELLIDDFKKARDEIIQKVKEKDFLEKEVRNLRDNLNLEQQRKEKLTNELTDLKVDLKEKKTTSFEKVKSIEEKQKNIRMKIGNDAKKLDVIKEEISTSIKDIEKEFVNAEMKKNEIEKIFNDCNSKIIAAQGNLVSLKERITKDKEALEKALVDEGIKDINEAKNSFIIKTEIDNLKSIIENYNNSLAQLNGAMTSLIKKINNRSLTKEQWTIIQNIKKEKTELLNSLQEASISIETEVKSIVVKLEYKKVLLRKKEELDHNLGLLNDLDKLFRGKKFIEYVAANQLKYVCIEASKKLKEITGGTYGLEVDENGKFLIRDYKNGGAQRDASTLSGGETFVASLALALALSSQIQLKGTAPLELFFLDEGFGTLDDNLLDVVLDSLERIHNDKLSIGIISHVESIKNRVPIKLIVTPAEAGMGGSKVRIEKS